MALSMPGELKCTMQMEAEDFLQRALRADWETLEGWLAAAENLFEYSMIESREWRQFQTCFPNQQQDSLLFLDGRSPKWVVLAIITIEWMLNIPSDYSRRKKRKYCRVADSPELDEVRSHLQEIYRLLCLSWKEIDIRNRFKHVEHWQELKATAESGLKAVKELAYGT